MSELHTLEKKTNKGHHHYFKPQDPRHRHTHSTMTGGTKPGRRKKSHTHLGLHVGRAVQASLAQKNIKLPLTVIMSKLSTCYGH